MKSKSSGQQAIYELIELITPLNNRYRDLVKGGSDGTSVLLVMWEVGEILENFISTTGIKPHNLYWQIYGKAEGSKTSYITRDFLSYCLRIKRFFKNQHDIKKVLPSLQRYSLFREAFPLLENPKYKLSSKETSDIYELLNSNSDPADVKRYIVSIKDKNIGIKNPRTQRLEELESMTKNFVSVYNEVYSFIKNDSQGNNAAWPSKSELNTLSEAVSSMTQENLFVPDLALIDRVPISAEWKIFIENLEVLFAGPVETRNRFRRLISPRKIYDLADMLNAFVVDDGVKNYKKRKGIA